MAEALQKQRLCIGIALLAVVVMVALLAGSGNGLFGTATDTDEDEGPLENECLEGGSMEGKCDTTWEWAGGWYLAAWYAAGGCDGEYEIPDAYKSLQPVCETVSGGDDEASGGGSGDSGDDDEIRTIVICHPVLVDPETGETEQECTVIELPPEFEIPDLPKPPTD